MHACTQQANFYAANWDKGTKVAPRTATCTRSTSRRCSDKFGKPIEGGGEFVGAFTDRPEVEAVQLYLASGEVGDLKATRTPVRTSGWATANKKVDKSVFKDPIDKLSVDILTDPKSTFRFDASDAMPASVGAGSFWTQMTQWILGQSDQGDPRRRSRASWPK